MKRIPMRSFCLFLLVLMAACSKEEDPGFTSLLGSWQYTTPDEKIVVTFDIVGGTSDVLAIQKQTIVVDGREGRAEVQANDIQETSIGSVRINANDAALTFPYSITFNKLTPNEDFTAIRVEEATYIFPWPTSNPLSNIEIMRK